MNKEVTLRILEEDAYQVVGTLHTSVNANESGTINRDKLRKEKEQYLKLLTSYLADDLITMKQQYPINDIVDVELNSDFVILTRRDFDYVKKYVESLIDIKDIMVHE